MSTKSLAYKPVLTSCVILLALSLLLVTGCCSTKHPLPLENQDKAEAPVFTYAPETDALCFNEIWGYVMVGRENEFSPAMPLSDVGYFVGAIGIYSEVLPVVAKEKHFAHYTGRVHLVTTVDTRAQVHVLLDPTLPLRKKLLAGLVEAASTYDGLQIDWEAIGERDIESFLSFLQELKDGLGEKTLSVALPARTKTLTKDPFDYARIATIADRMIIMAYDEHWSTSKPGAVASYDWCKRIAEYTLLHVPTEKIVMGLPFYGRTWGSYTDANRAFGMANISRLQKENGIHDSHIQRENGIPSFTYEHKTTVTVWYNDAESIRTLASLYKALGIAHIGFWRVGQEEQSIWQELKLTQEPSEVATEQDEKR